LGQGGRQAVCKKRTTGNPEWVCKSPAGRATHKKSDYDIVMMPSQLKLKVEYSASLFPKCPHTRIKK
jgi:hypothetical protein